MRKTTVIQLIVGILLGVVHAFTSFVAVTSLLWFPFTYSLAALVVVLAPAIPIYFRARPRYRAFSRAYGLLTLITLLAMGGFILVLTYPQITILLQYPEHEHYIGTLEGYSDDFSAGTVSFGKLPSDAYKVKFSPNRSEIAYVTGEIKGDITQKQQVHLRDREQNDRIVGDDYYLIISELAFSRDGASVGFIALKNEPKDWKAKDIEKVLVIDGKQIASGEQARLPITWLTDNSDSLTSSELKRQWTKCPNISRRDDWRLLAGDAQAETVTINGSVSKPFRISGGRVADDCSKVVFLRPSHYELGAIVVGHGSGKFTEGKRLRPSIVMGGFSPDGKFLAYGGIDDDNVAWWVVDDLR